MFGFAGNVSSVQDIDWFLTREIRIALIAGIIFSMPILPGLVELRDKLLVWLKGVSQTLVTISFGAFHKGFNCISSRYSVPD